MRAVKFIQILEKTWIFKKYINTNMFVSLSCFNEKNLNRKISLYKFFK